MRKRKKLKSLSKKYNINIPSLSTHSFLHKDFGFSIFSTVTEFLKHRGIFYRLIKNLDGPGEYENGQYNCNMIFFSHRLPEERKVVAYWDYEKQFLYY